MKATLQKLLVQCLQDSKKEFGNYNIERYPSQVKTFKILNKIFYIIFFSLKLDFMLSRKYCIY